MTDKELRRMSRSELLQMLIVQAEENKALREQLDQARAELDSRRIAVEKAGNLAEAALSLNGVFQAAENAAQQYLENVRMANDLQENSGRDMQAKAEQEAADLVREARDYNRKVHAQADAYWKQVMARVEALLRDQEALRALIASPGREGNHEAT